MPKQEKLLIFVAIVTFILLLVAMVGTVVLNSTASGTLYSDPPFALSSLISGTQRDIDAVELGSYVLPSFIGVSIEGKNYGISIGDNVVRELYDMLSPCLATGLSATPESLTQEMWLTLAEDTRAVYLRYHSALPVSVLWQISGGYSEASVTGEIDPVLPVRELFLLLPDGENSDCQLILQDTDGNVWRYLCQPMEDGQPLENIPTLSQVQTFVMGLSANFYRYRLLTQVDGTLEPVFLERMRVRNVLLTPGTAVMMQENRKDDLEQLLVRFDFNPDKLSAHEEADGTQVIVESHGVFQVQNDRLTYTASSEGGVALQQYIGYQESYSLSDCLRAACTLLETVRDIHPYYLGGDADVILTEVSRTEGRLRMVFQYTFDNLPLQGCDPAAVVEVENDRVMQVELYAIALRSMGDFDSSYLECGVVDWENESYYDVTLTYPADFGSGSVFPVWTLFAG